MKHLKEIMISLYHLKWLNSLAIVKVNIEETAKK